jgi:hypothetical protein
LHPNTLPSKLPQRFALTNLVVLPNHRPLLLQLQNILQFQPPLNKILSAWAPLQRNLLNRSVSFNFINFINNNNYYNNNYNYNNNYYYNSSNYNNYNYY